MKSSLFWEEVSVRVSFWHFLISLCDHWWYVRGAKRQMFVIVFPGLCKFSAGLNVCASEQIHILKKKT